MGNCLSGLAFKPEDDDDEYGYQERRPKPRANIQTQTSSRAYTGYNNGFVAHSDAEANASLEERLRELKKNKKGANIQTETPGRANPGYIYRFVGFPDDEANEPFERRMRELKEKNKTSDDIFEPRPEANRVSAGYNKVIVEHLDEEASAGLEKALKELREKMSADSFGTASSRGKRLMEINDKIKEGANIKSPSHENTEYINRLKGHPDAEANEAFEKRMRELKEKKKGEVITKSSTVIRVVSGPTSSEKVKEAISELEREYNLRRDSVHSSKLDIEDEEAEEEEQPSAQVRNKTFKREFRKKQPKVKKPRVSRMNFEVSNIEEPNLIDGEQKLGSDLESPPTGYTNRLTGHPDAEANAAFEKRMSEIKEKKEASKNKKKRLPAFHIAKPNNTYKKVADSHKRKNQNRQRIALLA